MSKLLRDFDTVGLYNKVVQKNETRMKRMQADPKCCRKHSFFCVTYNQGIEWLYKDGVMYAMIEKYYP